MSEGYAVRIAGKKVCDSGTIGPAPRRRSSRAREPDDQSGFLKPDPDTRLAREVAIKIPPQSS
jgi:hypothetical protein